MKDATETRVVRRQTSYPYFKNHIRNRFDPLKLLKNVLYLLMYFGSFGVFGFLV